MLKLHCRLQKKKKERNSLVFYFFVSFLDLRTINVFLREMPNICSCNLQVNIKLIFNWTGPGNGWQVAGEVDGEIMSLKLSV